MKLTVGEIFEKFNTIDALIDNLREGDYDIPPIDCDNIINLLDDYRTILIESKVDV